MRKLQPCRIVVTSLLVAMAAACGGGSGGGGPTGANAPDGATPVTPLSPPPSTSTQQPSPPATTGDPAGAAPSGAARSGSIAYEKRANGSRIWTVNPDNDSVSVVDATSFTLLAQVPVGRDPRTLARAVDGKFWVTNRSSSDISVIDPARLTVERTIPLPRASQPFGIVISPADGSPWVVLEALGRLVRLDRASGSVAASVEVGANPRHLSMPAAGKEVLVSRFISPPLPGEAGARPVGRTGTVEHGGEVVLVDAGAMTIRRTVVLPVSQRSDTSLQGRGIPNYLGAAAVAPDGMSAWVPSKQDNVMRGGLRDGLPLDFQSTVRAVSSRIALGDSAAAGGSLRTDHDNSGVASAAAFHPSGRYLFVALETSRHVAVVDPESGREIVRAVSGLAPQGLVVSDDGSRLFVDNAMERTIAVFDLTRLDADERIVLLAKVPRVTTEKVEPAVLRGKQLFYDALDPRLARDGYLSCASCHADGGGDGRTWDFTGFGEGLRNTISLRGRATAGGRLHWSGNADEIQDFEAQIRNFAGGRGLMQDADFVERADPLGRPKAGVSAGLDDLAAYVASLDTIDASPHRNPDGSLTPQALEGKSLFAASGCLTCHGGADLGSEDGALQDVGTLKPSSGQRLGGSLTGIDTPRLRGAWSGAPYLHDGSAAGVAEAIAAHSSASGLRAEDLARLSAYVMQVDGRD